jgi:type IV fimbrial biogenesis protein FimT
VKRSVREGVSFHDNCLVRAKGMTFVELLIVLSIAAIMLTLAVPSFDAVLQGSRFSTFANAYLTNLHLARSEATKRNTRVALCKSSDGASCTAAGRWDQGWILFNDINNNAQTDSGETILRVNEALPPNWVLQGNTPVTNYVSYAAMGGARMTSGAFQAGTLTLCRASQSSGEARSIVISATGRPRVQTTSVATCP